MPEGKIGSLSSPELEPIAASIYAWMRVALGARDELGVSSPQEVARMARELSP